MAFGLKFDSNEFEKDIDACSKKGHKALVSALAEMTAATGALHLKLKGLLAKEQEKMIEEKKDIPLS
jgi:hypothetical protein